MHWYLRPATVVAIARQSSYLFVVPSRPQPTLLEGLDVDAMAAVLGCTTLPIAHDELVAQCDEAAINLLVELGVLVRGTEAEIAAQVERPEIPPTKRCKTIVVGLSGAVSVASAIKWVVSLADHFAERVEVVISEGAQNFIQPRLYEYYGFRVWLDPFAPVHGVAVPHSYLATAADLVLVAPASCSMLHKLASGACSDLISLVVAATKAPVVVAPSTNPQMWLHPPVQRNVAQLRADGMWVVEPGIGTKIAARDQGGVGALAFDVAGMIRALDVIVEPRPPAK